MKGVAMQTQNKLPIVQGEALDSDQVYQGDIYGKGAFFMHTLRYVLGDSIFFPTLKKLATDPQYTYDNAVTTDDVLKLFEISSGKSLKSLFDLFLRTTNKLEVSVKQIKPTEYRLQILNLDMTLPMEVSTDAGVRKIILGKDPVVITSATLPLIDPKVYYLKKVILE
jgi:aminopeptidase N